MACGVSAARGSLWRRRPHAELATGSAERGLTLVELLVVMGIIALLIGPLLPVLAGARRAARLGAHVWSAVTRRTP